MTAQDLLAHAVLEPDARLAEQVHARAALRAVIRDASHLSGLLQIRKRYRLLSGQNFSQFPEELQQHSRSFDTALASALEHVVLLLQGERQTMPAEVAENQVRLQQSYSEHHRIDGLPADLAMEWELRFILDQQIMALITKIEKTALAAVSWLQDTAVPARHRGAD